jgi:hypothetical protein
MTTPALHPKRTGPATRFIPGRSRLLPDLCHLELANLIRRDLVIRFSALNVFAFAHGFAFSRSGGLPTAVCPSKSPAHPGKFKSR